MSDGKGGRWIRLDTTWSSSEWVANLEPEPRLCWVELLCYVKAHGYAGKVKALTPTVAARLWGVTRNAVVTMLDAARGDAALQITEDEWVVTGWDTYQPDKSAPDRQRRYRERQQQDTQLPTPEAVTPVTRNVRYVTPTETETGTETKTKEAAAPAHAEFSTWMGEHAGCLAHLEPLVRSAIWGLWGPHGVQAHDWKGIAPPRQQAVLATVILTYAAEHKRGFHRPFFAKILARAVDDAIAADRKAVELDTEQTTANELREQAKRLEQAEIARLQAEAERFKPEPVNPQSGPRGTGLRKISA